FFCFFFQAEDGIRDLTVTGVQTCALPIYWPRFHSLIGEACISGEEFSGKLFWGHFWGHWAVDLGETGLFCQKMAFFCKNGLLQQIGRASCRERVCVREVGVTLVGGRW